MISVHAGIQLTLYEHGCGGRSVERAHAYNQTRGKYGTDYSHTATMIDFKSFACVSFESTVWICNAV